jgi:hypothetical protein
MYQNLNQLNKVDISTRTGKGKGHAHNRPQRPKGIAGRFKAPDFFDVRQYEGGRSSASRICRLHPQGKSLVLIFRG